MIYKYLKVDGSIETIETELPLTLKEMQTLVGGYIEFFEHYSDHYCCNEEGLLRSLPENPHFIDRDIRGNVVLGKWSEGDEDRVFIGIK